LAPGFRVFCPQAASSIALTLIARQRHRGARDRLEKMFFLWHPESKELQEGARATMYPSKAHLQWAISLK
jgi:hypothetical protein